MAFKVSRKLCGYSRPGGNRGLRISGARATRDRAVSRCRDSFIIVGSTTIIENETFQSWKDTKKNSDGIHVDNLKPSLICYVEELAKRNLVIKQGKAYAKISLHTVIAGRNLYIACDKGWLRY